MAVEFLCDNLDKLYIRVSGALFTETIEKLKSLHARYEPETWLWSVSLSRYKEILEELQHIGNRVSISALTQKYINEYANSLKELEPAKVRRVYHPELMKYPPFIGKSPYENFQKEDFIKAINVNRFLFNHAPGLGKSWETAALIEHLRYYGEIENALIFSSGIGVYNLKNELLKFGVNITEKEILVLSSIDDLGKYEDRNVFLAEKYPYKILIMTYDVLKSVSDFYHAQATGKKKVAYKKSPIPWYSWTTKPIGLFLDECHALSNPTSRRSEIIFQNLKQFKYRYLFSATPADKYEKLYSILKCLDLQLTEGLSYPEWCATYNDIGTRWSKYAINQNAWHMDKITALNKKLLRTYSAKRLKEDVLDLPPNYEIPVFGLDMTPKHRKIYEKFSNETVFKVQKESQESGQSSTDNLMMLFQYLQLSIDNPKILESNPKFGDFSPELQKMINQFDYQKDFKKLEALDSVIEERVDDFGEKGIIWAYHPLTIENLKVRYAKYNPVILDASVPQDDRFNKIKQFQQDDKSKLIIMSIMVANTSITLVECKWEFYIEKIYNYSVYYQSRGRIVRPGQTGTTRTYGACYNKSIDYLQTQNLQNKGFTINQLFNKDFVDASIWKKIFNADSSLIV